MTTRKLRVMPNIEVPPSDASILQPAVAPALKGEGAETYLCGKCETILVQHVDEGQIADLFIVCPQCQAMNDVNP